MTRLYEGNIAIMCRGIRCEDCWNHDVVFSSAVGAENILSKKE